MKKNITYLLFVLFVTTLFTGCNNSNNTFQNDNDTLNNAITIEHTKKVKKIFYNVPSPIEMANVLHESGVQYKPEILVPFKAVDKYVNVPKQALILGVYGSDLSYVRLFDQIQQSINYLSSIKKLTGDLNIPEDQGSFAVNRLENNMDNRDSLLQIVTETYSSANTYLKENERGNTATLIILGGWIEALYISTNIVDFDNPKNKQVINRIAEQKYSLSNLIELIKGYPNDKELKEYLPLMNNLHNEFSLVDIKYEKRDVVTDENKKLTTINSIVTINISKSTFEEIKKTITEIRNKIIIY